MTFKVFRALPTPKAKCGGRKKVCQLRRHPKMLRQVGLGDEKEKAILAIEFWSDLERVANHAVDELIGVSRRP
ncbi:MAG TPA: hypothetical protein VGQ93_11235 [Lysobacter sp.]|jgi:hypothetical protein|nr:hypothetical protein [Lysobacter sp.]